MKKWYDKYVGIPFADFKNDLTTGIDCVNLTITIFKNERNININTDTSELCPLIERGWYNKLSEDIMLQFFEKYKDYFEEIDKSQLKIFDIILFSIGSTNITNHCAMYVDNNKILHTMENKKSWISPYGRYYKNYTIKAFRWKSQKNIIN